MRSLRYERTVPVRAVISSNDGCETFRRRFLHKKRPELSPRPGYAIHGISFQRKDLI
jgi:hypothetical protein